MHINKLGTLIRPSMVVQDKLTGEWYVPTITGTPSYLTFATDWCGYCQRLAPEMETARLNYNIRCYYLDGDNPETSVLMKQMGVSGFPTICIVKSNGQLVPYRGSRSARDLALALGRNPLQ